MSSWPTTFASNDSGAIDSFDVGELLTSLTDKSLVVLDQETGRYYLLETIRDYARVMLASVDESDGMRAHHLDYFVRLGEDAEAHLTGADQQAWLKQLETEHDNIRAALEWSISSESEAGLRLAGSIWRFWYVHGHYAEGRSRFAGLLSVGERDLRTLDRARALGGAGALASLQGDFAAARALIEDSLAIRKDLGDRAGIAISLSHLGILAYYQGEYPLARALYTESRDMFGELGDRRGIANSLDNLGTVAHDQGDLVTARALQEEGLQIRRELGDRAGIAVSLHNLGNIACEQGDYSAARTLHHQSLQIRTEIGDRRGIAFALADLGRVAHEQGDHPTARGLQEQSLRIRRDLGDRLSIAESLEALAADLPEPGQSAHLWGAAQRLREKIGAPIPPIGQRRYLERVAAMRAAQGDVAAFDAAWQEGRAMPLEQAIELALGEGAS